MCAVVICVRVPARASYAFFYAAPNQPAEPKSENFDQQKSIKHKTKDTKKLVSAAVVVIPPFVCVLVLVSLLPSVKTSSTFQNNGIPGFPGIKIQLFTHFLGR